VVVSLWGSTLATHPICATTPCAANLPYGTYTLIFRGRNDPAQESSENRPGRARAPASSATRWGPRARRTASTPSGIPHACEWARLVAGFGLLGLAGQQQASVPPKEHPPTSATGPSAAGLRPFREAGLLMYYGRPVG
jgi:hypothetical protein